MTAFEYVNFKLYIKESTHKEKYWMLSTTIIYLSRSTRC